MAEATCAHIEAITTVKHAKRRQCDECVKIGAKWVHLRTCQECGTTRCCDDSPNRHAYQARADKQTSRDRIRRSQGSIGCIAIQTTPLRNTESGSVCE